MTFWEKKIFHLILRKVWRGPEWTPRPQAGHKNEDRVGIRFVDAPHGKSRIYYSDDSVDGNSFCLSLLYARRQAVKNPKTPPTKKAASRINNPIIPSPPCYFFLRPSIFSEPGGSDFFLKAWATLTSLRFNKSLSLLFYYRHFEKYLEWERSGLNLADAGLIRRPG